ncbi:MAG: secondary thiamine-phosphate synthase enzyme YjbQ [Thermoanaerobacteraceae bacterium]
MHILELNTMKKQEMINITDVIEKFILESKIEEGICTVFVPHTTAGVTINENADPTVVEDILNALDRIVPDIRFKHLEGNSDAHIKASLMGSSVNLIIEKRNLVLGTWQGVYFCEFDGPRKRKLYVRLDKLKALE